MKFHLTVAALVSALVINPLSADEPKASAPAALENVGDSPSVERDADGKPHKTVASTPARKVATDYAPAQNLLLSAMSLIGVKYKWGGSTPEAGLDCSGFVNYVFKNSLNIALPRTAFGMSAMGDNIEKDELKPGDLVFFNTLKRRFSHVGIYLGDGRFIHSPRKGRSVEIVDINQKYWATRFDGARRMGELGEGGVDVTALLAGRPARQPSAVESDGKSCRKVTSTRKGKKVTSTICSTNKSTKAKSKTGTASVPAKSKAKSPAKKPAAPAAKKKR